MAVDLSALMQAPPQAPPVKRGPGRPRKTAVASEQRADRMATEFTARKDGLMGIAQLLQGGLMLGKQYADAAAVGMHAEPIATEVAKLAMTEPAVAKTIDLIIQAGPYAALISAVMPLALQLAANHGLVPTTMQGVVPPEVLQAQMEAQMLQMQADAYRAQMEAQRAAEAARNDLRAFVAMQEQAQRGQVNGYHPATENSDSPSV